jgi:hypothetical protein
MPTRKTGIPRFAYGAVTTNGAIASRAHGALAQTSLMATPGRACTVVQQVSVELDLNLPVGTSVARVDCDLTEVLTYHFRDGKISEVWDHTTDLYAADEFFS